jgi:hypothetical protein
MNFVKILFESFRLESAFTAASKDNYELAISRARLVNKNLGNNSFEAQLLCGHCLFKMNRFSEAIVMLNAADILITKQEELSKYDKNYLREYVRQHFETENSPLVSSKEEVRKVSSRFRKQFPLSI